MLWYILVLVVANPLTVDNTDPKMQNDKEDTINKSLLLNWLYSSDKDLPLEELSKWIAAKTDGKYSLVKNSNMRPPSLLDEIKHK